ncbi:MAG: hypothetical protein ACO2PN_08965 [Pyrobaculum sp.]|jgi:hypothetical protein
MVPAEITQKSGSGEAYVTTLAAKAIPAVVTSGGRTKRFVFIKSRELAPRLQQFLNAGVRRVEVAAYIESLLLTFEASIVRRGPQQPLYLHPIGETGRFLTELYKHRRAASGRKHNPLPMLILSVTPLLEKSGGGGKA